MRLTDEPCCKCERLTVCTVAYISQAHSYRVPCCDLCRLTPARELHGYLAAAVAELVARSAQLERHERASLN